MTDDRKALIERTWECWERKTLWLDQGPSVAFVLPECLPDFPITPSAETEVEITHPQPLKFVRELRLDRQCLRVTCEGHEVYREEA